MKIEVRKSILYSNHVYLGTNKYDPKKVEESLLLVSSSEDKMNKKLKQDLKSYEGMLDEKLEKILRGLKIEFDVKSINHKKLRRYFIDLYLLRFDFTTKLINETGITDDDFRLEVEEKLKISLFPELSNQPTQQVSSVTTPTQTKTDTRSSHQNTLLSVGIESHVDEKGTIRSHSEKEIRHSLT